MGGVSYSSFTKQNYLLGCRISESINRKLVGANKT
jgi:hypothetical protein